MVEKRRSQLMGSKVHYIGTSHWMCETVRDAIIESDPDIICAEAPPSTGLTNRPDQKQVESFLKITGTPIVPMDSDNRYTKQQTIEEFGESKLEEVNEANSRQNIRRVSPKFYDKMFIQRESTMRERIRRTASKINPNETITVVVGSMHIQGLMK